MHHHPVRTEEFPGLPNPNNILLDADTPAIAIDHEKTKHRENAIAVRDGKLLVLIAIPKDKLGKGYRPLLEFAKKTFSLSDSVPLRNSESLQQSELKQDQPFSCLCIEISIDNPEKYCLRIQKETSVRFTTTDTFDQDEYYSTVSLALHAFTNNLRDIDFGYKKGVPEFNQHLSLLTNYAYLLVHNYLSAKGIPHIYHSSKDNFRELFFGYGGQDLDSVAKAPLGSPLRRVTCFINMLQLLHYLQHKTSLFSGQQVEDLIANINELKGERHSIDRKEVISNALCCLKPGNFEVQPNEFKQREYLLIDHLAHSAPLPPDAWIILQHEAIPSEAKKQVMQHAADNPHYAYSLLLELNKNRQTDGCRYKVEEDLDFKSGIIKLKIRIKDRSKSSEKKAKDQLINLSAPIDDFFTTLHQLRFKAIQQIAGFWMDQGERRHFVPLSVISSSCGGTITSYIKQKVEAPLKQLGFEFKTFEIGVAEFSYYQLQICRDSAQIYSYETTPIHSGFKDRTILTTAEALNFLARKMTEYGLSLEYPEDNFGSNLPEDLQRSGLDMKMLHYTITFKKSSTEMRLSYKLRLIGGNATTISKIVALPYNKRYFIDKLAHLRHAAPDIVNEAADQLIEETYKDIINQQKMAFLREVAKKLKLSCDEIVARASEGNLDVSAQTQESQPQ